MKDEIKPAVLCFCLPIALTVIAIVAIEMRHSLCTALQYELSYSEDYANEPVPLDKFLLERYDALWIGSVSSFDLMKDIKELRARRFNLTNNGESNDNNSDK